MEKPTSKLLSDIVEFVTNQKNIAEALSRRDNHKEVIGTSLSCRFHKRHSSDKKRAAYNVKFGYVTKNDDLEKNDDVLVRVEVVESSPPKFRILKVSFE